MPLATTPSLADRLAAAQAEGLEANLRRWLAFRGWREGEPLELQALHVKSGNFESSFFAHASDIATATRLAADMESRAPGVYVIANQIHPAVATRKKPGAWHVAPKGGSTSDTEITQRAVLYVDIDVTRPKGTSATDVQVSAALRVTEQIADAFAGILDENAIGAGHSGNGGCIFVRLANLPNNEATETSIKTVLAAVKAIYSTSEISIDVSVSDAKRLIPAFGTMKQKGAPDIADRPHRRTAFVCADQVRAINAAELAQLVDALTSDLDADQRVAMDRTLGKRATPPSRAPSPTPGPMMGPFARANSARVEEVVAWQGLMGEGGPVCPGCGSGNGTSDVALVADGLKCMHARCASKGRGGFYTPVDIVAEAMHVEPIEAAKMICDRFGLAPPPRATPPPPRTSPPMLRAVPSSRTTAEPVAVAEPEGFPVKHIWDVPEPGPLEWLIKDLWTAGGFGWVGGEPKERKSWLTLYLALCVASGRPAFDRWEVQRGPVLIFSAEGGVGLVRRRTGLIARAMGLAIGDVAALDLRVIDIPVLHLDKEEHRQRFLHVVDQVKPVLIVLDPLRELHTADENDSAVIAALLAPLRILRASHGAAVMLVHHMKKAGENKSGVRGGQRLRGSSALHGANDCALYLDGEGAGKDRRVTVNVELRAAEEPEPFIFQLKSHSFPEGDAVWPALVVEGKSGDDERTSINVDVFNAAKKRVLTAVKKSIEPLKSKNAIARRAKGNKTHILKAVEELQEDGEIVFEGGVFRIPAKLEMAPSGTGSGTGEGLPKSGSNGSPPLKGENRGTDRALEADEDEES